jgi:hypothetical protein
MLTLPKSSGRTEGKFNLAIAFRSLFVELGIGAKIRPRLSGLRRTQKTQCAIAFHPKTDIPLQSVWVGNLEQFTVIGLNPEAAAEFIRLYVGDFLQNEDQS